MMQSVQVIIERLKTHPEDFFGDLEEVKSLSIRQPKFSGIVSKLDDLILEKTEHPHRLWFLNEDEQAALIEAYKEARRARFEAKVFHTLLTTSEPQEANTVTYKTQGRYHPHTGKALMDAADSGSYTTGWSDPRGIITPASMMSQAQQILEKEFDKVYDENRNPRS